MSTDVADAERQNRATLNIAQAGEGARQAENPFESLMLPAFPGTERDETSASPQPATDTGTSPPAAAGTAAKLIANAKQFLGTPYKWGGTSPLGFDCSGFVQYVFKNAGIDLPRVSYQQAQAGKRISIAEAKPGDLVAWDTSDRNNGADHIAIYLGGGLVIHAPKPGDAVKISKIWGNPWAVSMNV